MWPLLMLYIAGQGGNVPSPPAVAAARVEALHGRVWHDDAPVADASYRMTCVMEYLGSRGEVTKTLVLEHRRSFTGGRLTEELVSAREDGRDVTERERRKQAAADDRQASPSRWSLDEVMAPPLPFLSARGDGYRVTMAAGGVSHALDYRPGQGASGRAATGSVVLDPSDGLPLRHQFVPVPLPRMIRSMVTNVRYRRLGGIAVPEFSECVGEGGLLFIKRRFRVTMSYRDWRLGAPIPAGPR